MSYKLANLIPISGKGGKIRVLLREWQGETLVHIAIHTIPKDVHALSHFCSGYHIDKNLKDGTLSLRPSDSPLDWPQDTLPL